MTTHTQATKTATPRRAAHFAAATPGSTPNKPTKNSSPAAPKGEASARRIGAIDGLRALAIAGVVLYHLRPSMLAGGFLGVTVFLVITGFLATRSVMGALDRGTFAYGRYLLRRVARLLPPVLVVVALTALATYLASPSLLPKVQADALPGSLFFSNWSYIFRQVSYFQAAGLPSPLTHLWYLGVVMQFYVIWPLALMAVWHSTRSRNRRRRRTIALVCALALASFAIMALLYDPLGDTARVYYGTDARAAELLAGALVAAVLPMSRSEKDAERAAGTGVRAAATVAGCICLAALIGGFVLANGGDPLMYRGGYLATAVGTAVLLACAQVPGSPLGRALSLAPLRWLGTRSFSVYLVHYPMLILMNPATRTTAPAWWEQALQIALVLLVAEVFYRLVEAPCERLLKNRREGRRARGTAPAAVPACLGVLAAGAIGLLAFAPVDWEAVSQERAVTLRPELAASQGETTGDDAEPTTDAPSDGKPESDPAEQEPEATEPKPSGPVAEKVPDNLPWESWSYDEASGTCDARALIIGDSVTEGATPALEAVLPEAFVDGAVSRQLYVGQDIYAADVASGYDPDVVIFALGGNSLIRDESTVQALIDAVDGKPMFFVTIRSPYPLQDLNNEILRRYASENANVGIIDWCGESEGHSEYLVDDGVHLTDAGTVAFSQLIRRALCGQ